MATQFDLDLIEWQKAQQALKTYEVREAEMRRKVFATAFPQAVIGTNTLPLGATHELKGVRKQNYNLKHTADGRETDAVLDEIERVGNIGALLADRLVSWKPSLNLTEYKKLDVNNKDEKRIKDLIDSVLTITDGMPTLEVKEKAAK